jgi:uncharacterized membrane protein HdeD (DUF308 family)
MHQQILSPAPPLLDAIKENASFAVTSGAILITAGMIALMSPMVARLSITIMVGVLLAIGGIGQCMLAVKAGAFDRTLLVFIVGVLMAVAGFYVMSQPIADLASMTLILVVYLVVAGLFELVVALQLRPADGWGWALFNGIVTLLLGVMLWRQFPLSGEWAIGILFGIKMVVSGWLLVIIGITAKEETKPYYLFTC